MSDTVTSNDSPPPPEGVAIGLAGDGAGTAGPESAFAPPESEAATEVSDATDATKVSATRAASRAVVCPFLISESGDWRLAVPAREHRCAAFTPMTSLALEKQTRLCLTADHLGCATYLASLAARETRVGSPQAPERAGRWAIATVTPFIEDAGGVRARILAFASDRRTWPAVPAVVLVATLLALGLANGGTGQPATAFATASPEPATSNGPTATLAPPTSSPTPIGSPSPTSEPTAAPSVGPTPAPAYSTTYKVKSGDTLSAIATKFHTTVAAIKTLNGITNAARLHIGQILKIP